MDATASHPQRSHNFSVFFPFQFIYSLVFSFLLDIQIQQKREIAGVPIDMVEI